MPGTRGKWILIALLAVLALPGAASAATIQVETTADSVADNQTCSLREAIASANTNLQVDDCEVGDPAPTADTISIPTGNYLLTAGQLSLDPSAPNGDVTLQGAGASATTIDAQDADRVLQIAPSSETITISGLTLTHGTVIGSGGGINSSSSLDLVATRVNDNHAPSGLQAGGGIALFSGASLTTSGATQINNNTVSALGGGVALVTGGGDIVIGPGGQVNGNSTNGAGGGLATNTLADPNSDIVVDGASVSNNFAGEGGGIYFVSTGPAGGDVTLDGATVDGNRLNKPLGANPSRQGGGMHVRNGDDLTITDSSVSGNVIETPGDGAGGDQFFGAGVSATMANLDITGSEISGNTINVFDNGDLARGGGISWPGAGGQISIDSSTIANNTLTSPVAGNTGTFSGGGAFFREPTTSPVLEVRNSTISGNSAGSFPQSTGGAILMNAQSDPATLELVYSTVANNTANQFSAIDIEGGVGGIYSLSQSIIDNGATACDGTGSSDAMSADAGTSCVGAVNDTDFENVDANLGSLSDNGGPTRTNMLIGPSQLIDVDPAPCVGGLNPNPLEFDQRGFLRPVGAGCDIGAVEVDLPETPVLSGFNPNSPADDNTPEVTGNGPSGSTIDIYSNDSCAGPPVATGTAAELGSPGITVNVPNNSTTTFSATATTPDGTSPCSNATTYEERTIVPATPKRCAGVKATRVGTPGRNTITGTNKRDVIVALGGNDTVRGRGGNDLICLGGGNDKGLGGGGNDIIRGEGGRDTLKGDAGKDKLLGAAGRDTLSGGGAADLLNAAAGRRELCDGGPARDKFRGCERVRGRP